MGPGCDDLHPARPLTIGARKGITKGMVIYKIFRAPDWEALLERGHTHGTADDLADGFIHFSTAEQLAETCRRHFAGEEGLILAAIDSEDFGNAMKWEPSRGGELFPHLYRKLRLCDVMWHKPLPLGPDGRHRFPEGVPA